MAKRTAEDASRSTSAASQTEEGQERQVKKRRTDGSVASPAKKATAAPRQTKKTKGATPDVGPKREPQPKRLDKALTNKIKQVKAFRTEHDSDNNLLTRSEHNSSRIVIAESALAGALVAMASDWGVEETYLAAFLDTEGAVIKRFNKRHEYEEVITKLPMLVLDLSKTTILIQAINLKIEGHGLENVNLLQLQLEIYMEQLSEFGGKQLYHATEEAEVWTTDDDQLIVDHKAHEEAATTMETRADSPTDMQPLQEVRDTKAGEQEIARKDS